MDAREWILEIHFVRISFLLENDEAKWRKNWIVMECMHSLLLSLRLWHTNFLYSMWIILRNICTCLFAHERCQVTEQYNIFNSMELSFYFSSKSIFQVLWIKYLVHFSPFKCTFTFIQLKYAHFFVSLNRFIGFLLLFSFHLAKDLKEIS